MDGVFAPADPKLADDRLHEGVDRRRLYRQPRSDLLGGQVTRGQIENLAFAGCQPRKPGLGRAGADIGFAGRGGARAHVISVPVAPAFPLRAIVMITTRYCRRRARQPGDPP